MRKLVLAWLLAVPFFVAQADDKPMPLDLVMGVSKTLEFDQPIGNVILPKVIIDYKRLLDDSSEPRKLLLIPKKPGGSDFVINDKAGKRLVTYAIDVHAAGSRKFVERQKSDEKAHGLPVEDLTITDGSTKEVTYEFDIGPIFLTDPSLLIYKRQKPSDRQLLLIGNKPGLTDFTIYDSEGKIRKRYYVTVAKRAPASR